MRKELPNVFRVTVRHGNFPVIGQFAELELKTNYKNDYSFLIGPTNAAGQINVDRRKIIELGGNVIKWALMDYGPIENVYTGEYSVEFLQYEGLERVIESYERYQPEEKDAEIRQLRQALEQWHEGLRAVEVTCESIED